MSRSLARSIALLLVTGVAHLAHAQVPNAHWRTIETRHFHVHFTPALEGPARRAAAGAEEAYAQLSRRLHPPRGPIDLVVADNVDFSNGFTTPFPTNRIVVYAHPPLDVPSLRFYDDWLDLVITHELTHVFHLDRTRGWWRVAQHIFGRSPFLFPNQYAPAWLVEGLAVLEESDVSGAGRVNGSYERMLVETNVQCGNLYPLGQWNLTTTRYPDGDIAYGYGALFLDFLARTRGDGALRTFVERASGSPVPFFLNHTARKSFGLSFTGAWREWRDTLRANALESHAPLDGWRDLTTDGHLAIYPRWMGSDTIVYAANDWRETAGAYAVSDSGSRRRIGRRTSTDHNAPTRDGSIVFAQLEYTDPYHLRSDLWLQHGGSRTRLTRDARLAQPDVRRDGAIVAVRFGEATTQLVRVTAGGRTVTPITAAALDTEWAEPSWSPRGDRIAATRWTRGGWADVVILDTLGHLVRELTHDRAFDASPRWLPSGDGVLFTSDRAGITDVYVARTDGEAPPMRVSRATTGLYYPDVDSTGRTLAAMRWDIDGWHLGVAPLDSRAADRPSLDSVFADAPVRPADSSDAPAQDYSPWRTLWPRYWLPLIGRTGTNGYSFGAFTSGSDVIGRHAYFAQALIDPRDGEHALEGGYSWRGLGQPVLTLDAEQSWDDFGVIDTLGASIGSLRRRTRTVDLTVAFVRPRVYSTAYAALTGELEMRRYSTEPAPLIGELNPFYASSPRFWTLDASTGWSNAQHPVLAISAEDGVSVALTGRLRWLDGSGPLWAKEATAALSGYKSLALGGWAHHVLAMRVAGGVASGAAPDEYDLGGTTGTPVSLLPGVTYGSRRTFGVRGFPSGIETGTKIVVASAEYRAPLIAPHWGPGLWPVFLDRTSLDLFADAGSATGGFPSSGDLASHWISSVGAELSADVGVQYDVPYVLRLGVAAPVVNHSGQHVSGVSAYVLLGVSF